MENPPNNPSSRKQNFSIQPDHLNRSMMNVHPDENVIHVLDMGAYHNFLSIYDNLYVAEKSEEIFCGSSLIKPIQVYLATPTKNLSSSRKQIPKQLHDHIDLWLENIIKPFCRKLIRYEHAVSCVPIKFFPSKKYIFEEPRFVPTEQGRIFAIFNKLTCKTKYYFQWNTDNTKIGNPTNEEVGIFKNPKTTKSIKDKMFTKWNLYGVDQNTIPYDLDVHFYIGNEPKIERDNTLTYQQLIQYSINHGNHSKYGSVLPNRIKSSFTSIISRLFPQYLEYCRITESILRTEENKNNPTEYITTKLPGNGEILNMFADTKRPPSSAAHLRKRQELMSGQPNFSVERDPSAGGLNPNDLANLFEDEEEDNLNTFASRNQPSSSSVGTTFSTDSIMRGGNLDRNSLWSTMESLRYTSEGIYNEPVASGGKKRVIGRLFDDFKWAPQYSGRSDYIQIKEEFRNVQCQLFRLPTSVIHNSRMQRQELNATERDMIETSTREIANNRFAPFIEKIIRKSLKNPKDEFLKLVRGAAGDAKEKLKQQKQQKQGNREEDATEEKGGEEDPMEEENKESGEKEEDRSRETGETKPPKEKKTNKKDPLFYITESGGNNNTTTTQGKNTSKKKEKPSQHLDIIEYIKLFKNEEMPGLRVFHSDGVELTEEELDELEELNDDSLDPLFQYGVEFDIEVMMDIDQMISLYHSNLPTPMKAQILMNMRPKLGGLEKGKDYNYQEFLSMIEDHEKSQNSKEAPSSSTGEGGKPQQAMPKEGGESKGGETKKAPPKAEPKKDTKEGKAGDSKKEKNDEKDSKEKKTSTGAKGKDNKKEGEEEEDDKQKGSKKKPTSDTKTPAKRKKNQNKEDEKKDDDDDEDDDEDDDKEEDKKSEKKKAPKKKKEEDEKKDTPVKKKKKKDE